MMTKEQQIHELTRTMLLNYDCTEDYAKDLAEFLYDEGYRKIEESKEYKAKYFITTFTKYDTDQNGLPDIGEARTVGYYDSKEEAISRVLENRCDLWETIYMYAVVEYIEPGLYPIAVDRWFFKWNNDTRQYEPIEPFKDSFGNYAFG
jgi:hypothetical protein